MSGFVRTVQKRMMRRAGYVRQASKIAQDSTGAIRVEKFGRGEGPILNPQGDPWNGGEPGASFGPSRYWPRNFKAPTNPKAADLLARSAREEKRRAA